MEFVSRKFRRLKRRLSENTLPLLKWTWKAILSPLTLLGRFAAWLIEQTREWWKDRKLKNLLFGIPALLLIGLCLYFLSGHVGTSRFTRAQSYRRAGELAFHRADWKTASLFLSRSIELGADSNKTRFQLAQAAEKNNDIPRKVAILEELAPDGRPQYAPAHFWKAARILSSERVDPNELESGETHLRHVLVLEPNHQGANGVLGEIRYQQQRWSEAATLLERCPDAGARHRLMLARACLQKGDKDRARLFAREARDQAEKESLAAPENLEARLTFADATLLLEEYEESARILAEGLADSESKTLRAALTRVYIEWSDSIQSVETVAVKQKFALLSEGMKHNPHDFLLFDRLMSMLKAGGETETEGRSVLSENIAVGIAPGISHLVLGTLAEPEEDNHQSRFHLERAFELINDAPIVANNLAWYLCHQPDPELDRALRLVNRVLDGNTKEPAVRETRGQIYFRMGEFEKAQKDLEFALPHFRGNQELHESLGAVYAALDLPHLATEHRKIAENLAAKHTKP